jgi:hypothetical protein
MWILNPVRAKTIRHARQWKWSSYGATQGSSSLMVCLMLMKSSVISGSGRPTPRRIIPSLFKPESAILQSGTIFRPRVSWESKGLRTDFDTGTEEQQVREVPKGQRFLGRPSLQKPFSREAQARHPGTGLSPNLLQRTAIARWRVASFLRLHYFRRSAESSHSIKRKSKDLTLCRFDGKMRL